RDLRALPADPLDPAHATVRLQQRALPTDGWLPVHLYARLARPRAELLPDSTRQSIDHRADVHFCSRDAWPIALGLAHRGSHNPDLLRHVHGSLARVGLVARHLGRDRGDRGPDRSPGRSDLGLLWRLGR